MEYAPRDLEEKFENHIRRPNVHGRSAVSRSHYRSVQHRPIYDRFSRQLLDSGGAAGSRTGSEPGGSPSYVAAEHRGFELGVEQHHGDADW